MRVYKKAETAENWGRSNLFSNEYSSASDKGGGPYNSERMLLQSPLHRQLGNCS